MTDPLFQNTASQYCGITNSYNTTPNCLQAKSLIVNGSGRKPTFLGKNEEQIQHEISYHHQYGLLKYETAAFLYL